MNFLDMQQRVKSLINDTSGQFATDADIKNWLNEGQYDFVSKIVDDAIQDMIIASNISSVINQVEYSLPTNYLRIHGVRVDNVWASQLGIDDIRALDSNSFYSTNASNPIYYVRQGKIGISPTPTTNGTNNILVWHLSKPTELSADSDTSSIPIDYHQNIVLYAVMRAWSKSKELDKYQAVLNEYMGNITAINSRYAGIYNVQKVPSEPIGTQQVAGGNK